jgi:hypothetical protein
MMSLRFLSPSLYSISDHDERTVSEQRGARRCIYKTVKKDADTLGVVFSSPKSQPMMEFVSVKRKIVQNGNATGRVKQVREMGSRRDGCHIYF